MTPQLAVPRIADQENPVLQEAERDGYIHPHTEPRSRIFEGTSGSTGVSLAVVARALGYEAGVCTSQSASPELRPRPEIVLPDDTAREKYELIEKMGARVVKGTLVCPRIQVCGLMSASQCDR